MIPQSLAGIAILLLAVFIGFKLFKSAIKIGIVLILFLLGAYLIFGGLPSMGEDETNQIAIPEESRIKDIIVTAKDIAWGIEIVGTEWDSDGTLLIAVTNTGQLKISNIEIWVNDEEVTITNSPKQTLEKGDTTILDTNYMAQGPVKVRVKAGQAEDEITA